MIEALARECDGVNLPALVHQDFSPALTLLPVKDWSIYEDVGGLFNDGVKRIVIGVNPFGADYSELVLLRSDDWTFCFMRYFVMKIIKMAMIHIMSSGKCQPKHPKVILSFIIGWMRQASSTNSFNV